MSAFHIPQHGLTLVELLEVGVELGWAASWIFEFIVLDFEIGRTIKFGVQSFLCATEAFG